MGCEAGGSLHMLFFPLMAPGHMIPMLDMAKLFAARGVRATVLTTAANAPLLKRSLNTHSHTHVRLLPLPSAPLPCENLATVETHAARIDFFTRLHALRQPFEQVLDALRPDCVVADMFFPWAAVAARDRGVPLFAFHGFCFFALCAEHSVFSHELPPADIAGGDTPFILPGLPHRIEMHASQLPDFTKLTPEFIDLFAEMKGMVLNSYGVLVNSFYELEPDYADHYRTVVGVRAWHVGPVSLFNHSLAEQSARGGGGGNVSSVLGDCLSFLDGQLPGSVVYVCFGSLFRFASEQLGELARGLEDSGRPFLWVVRGGESAALPDGFEERVRERGLVIRGWAPQTVILGHVAVGGFVTHCGWNSSLEAISAGRAMVTWPLFADQFFNERLIVDVLRIGIGVGAKEFVESEETLAVVAAEEVRRAVERVMGDGEEAEGIRRRAGELAEKARRAVEKSGSSYEHAGNLIRELVDRKSAAREKYSTADV